ncbi:MAG: hypothetical protein EBY29_02780 [Planctomycetes bacterium]|nr:hypothetical protein [Planctomycetota bacterium]
MKPITRLWCLAMMCALLATFFSTPTARAADVEPLRSADLESRLKFAGFDDAQRAKILADYAAYVQRYSTSVAALIIEWQGLAGVQPSSIEEARTRQSKGRAAAQAIDDAERPLLDALIKPRQSINFLCCLKFAATWHSPARCEMECLLARQWTFLKLLMEQTSRQKSESC